jgi:hypothetical protein
MARSYGKLYQRIWTDPAWRALDVDAQHLYLLLISQPSMNMAGVLPIQLRRWSACVADWKPDQVEGALARLNDTGFTVTDEDTEEVLVRSLIRNDEAYRTPGMLKAILEAAQATQSPLLRRSLAAELGRLPALEGKTAAQGHSLIEAARRALGGGEGPPPGGRDGIAEPSREKATDTIPEPIPDGIRAPIREPIPEPIGYATGEPIPDTTSDAIPDTSVSVSGSVPRSSPVSSSSVSSADADQSATRSRTKPTGDDGFDRFWAAYPRKEAKRKAEQAWRSAIKRAKPAVILDGLARFHFRDDPQFIPHPATWLNQDRWADQPALPGARHLAVVAGGNGAEPSLTKAQIDEVLGPDYWQPPPPPSELWDDTAAVRKWTQQQGEHHRAQRVRQAMDRLQQTQGARAR